MAHQGPLQQCGVDLEIAEAVFMVFFLGSTTFIILYINSMNSPISPNLCKQLWQHGKKKTLYSLYHVSYTFSEGSSLLCP